jgi:hypothetical protein
VKLRLLTYFALLFSFCAKAQDFNTYHFNALYDFEQRLVFDIDQDADGNMWFGTSEGLVVFNGTDFQTFLHPDFNSAYTNIKFKYGRIWCSNFDGQFFYIENDSIHLAGDFKSFNSFIEDYILLSQHEVLVHINGRGTLERFDLENNHSTLFYKLNGKFITREQGDTLLLSGTRIDADGEFLVFAAFNLITESLIEEIASPYTSERSVRFLAIEGQSVRNFIVGDERLRRFVFEQNVFEEIFRTDIVSAFDLNNVYYAFDRHWLLSKRGLFLLDDSGQTLDKNLFPNLVLNVMFIDDEGNLWLGTQNDGIFIIPNIDVRSYKITESSLQQATFDDNRVLFVSDNTGRHFALPPPYQTARQIENFVASPAPQFFNPNDKTIRISHANGSSIDTRKLLGSEAVDSRLAFKYAYLLNERIALLHRYSRSCLVDLTGVPVDTTSLPYRFDYYSEEGNVTYVRDSKATFACEDAERKHLYNNFIDGLRVHYPDKTPAYVKLNGEPISVRRMIPAEDQGIWAIKSTDLLKIVGDSVVYSKRLPKPVYRMATWKHYLFLSYADGIYRLDTRSGAFESINRTDGYRRTRVIKLFTKDDTLIVVGGEGVQKLPCNIEVDNTRSPELTITSFKQRQTELNPDTTYALESDENQIHIEFNARLFSSQRQISYHYRLLPDTAWTIVDYAQSSASFTNLAPGKYTFQVHACNEDDVCSATKSLEFSIARPFVQTGWFYALLVLSAALIMFLVLRYRYRIRNNEQRLVLEQQRLRQEVFKSKIAAIRSQMNPHFMFNALNSIQEFIITNQQEIASEYLADFADLMRKYLNQSRNEKISIHEEVETLEIYLRLENLRFDDQLSYSVDNKVPAEWSEAEIPVMLIQPFVENSIKHGLLHKEGEKRLTVTLMKDSDDFICEIEDNGIGREASARINEKRSVQHKSFATTAMNDRIDMVHKSIGIRIHLHTDDLHENGRPSGTRVTLKVERIFYR